MAELDKIIVDEDIELELVVPNKVDIPVKYNNIKIVHYGMNIKFFWLNITFLIYLLKNNSTGIHLSVNVPWLKPDIVLIHDVNSYANPQFFSKYHTFKTKLEKKIAVLCAKEVFTTTKFNVDEIKRYLNYKKDNMGIVPCSWQHMKRIRLVGDAKSLFGVENGSYYFSLSSIAPTKNFKWVIEAAKQNPNEIFIIAGGTDPKTFGDSYFNDEVSNVQYIGRVSDEEVKVLMKNCKAFLFPSFYEGFGIPPLEALACGAPRIIISDIPVMREIYEDSAYYIDPFDYNNIDMEQIIKQEVSDIDKILNKYSWKKSAMNLIDILKR